MEQNLVLKSKDGNRDVTTSLIVANVFGKEHKNVLRDIQELSCSQEFRRLNFELSSYFSTQNKEMPMYEITKDGFSFLVMGYTGDKAGQFKEQFIAEFNKRELMLNSDEYIMARALKISARNIKALEERLLNKEKQLELAESIIKESTPKVEYHDKVLQAEGLITTTIIAKDLNMSPEALNLFLKKHDVIYKSQKTWVLYAKYVNKGYTGTKTYNYIDDHGIQRSHIQTYWTEVGRKFVIEFVNKIKGKSILKFDK
jgi:Rha family phage regulatory protein